MGTKAESRQIESVSLMFPQDRNLHGKVFGGILMRLVRFLLSPVVFTLTETQGVRVVFHECGYLCI